jgi:hypothetical protein
LAQDVAEVSRARPLPLQPRNLAPQPCILVAQPLVILLQLTDPVATSNRPLLQNMALAQDRKGL